jgi:bacteriocin-like protein
MSKDMNDKDLENISGGADTFDNRDGGTGGGGGGGSDPVGTVEPGTSPSPGGAPDPQKEAPGSDPGHLDT